MRLTKAMKAEIVESVVTSACKERIEKLEANKIEYAQHALNVLIGEENLSIMKQLPENYFQHSSRLKLSIANTTNSGAKGEFSLHLAELKMSELCSTKDYLCFYHDVKLVPNRALPAHLRYCAVINGNDSAAHLAIAKAGKKLHDAQEELVSDIKELVKTVTAALEGVTTDRRLAEHYPELAKHLPEAEAATKGLATTNESVRAAINCAASDKVKCK